MCSPSAQQVPRSAPTPTTNRAEPFAGKNDANADYDAGDDYDDDHDDHYDAAATAARALPAPHQLQPLLGRPPLVPGAGKHLSTMCTTTTRSNPINLTHRFTEAPLKIRTKQPSSVALSAGPA